ncbi:TetR/AcrR family transcriptional regulator [Shewanella atlantica]|uniref:TetR family transcriptional regulator n=1 Tax=Shewanella atlantica TaxID=271099 RepID=A0A3S0KFK3_9GAMM|nr:TetR family transcriptional regulator [Shewanella atlantica]RTR29740.1 TetR family transcriptional regulator [Shewanella atlantica]
MSVKERKRGRPMASAGQLSREVIVDKAKELMCIEGKVPSIRKLANGLQVDAMAIYHYFENKNALLEAITLSLIEAIYQPEASQQWQAELKQLSLSYLGLLQQYPGLLETMLAMTTDGPAAVFIERFQVAVTPLNLTDATLKNSLDLWVDYLHGLALAVNCAHDAHEIEPLLEGPLKFYMTALEQMRPLNS